MPPSLPGLTRPPVQPTSTLPAGPAAVLRADVQGLRALAVAAVVLYHLFPAAVPGGFVGVDVFFVISGFLITGHLVGEVERTGRIGLTRFWARRIRRLLPAAYLVLAGSTVLLLTVMPRLSWLANLQEIGASAGYVENWLLGVHATDYLAAQDTPTVAQHYWSLGVEEQFYMVWPLALLVVVALHRLLHRLLRRRLAGPDRGPSLRATVAVLLALGTGVSFLLSLRLSAASPALAFFATPGRAWEFGAGGLLALVAARRPGAPATGRGRLDRLRGPMSLLGLVGIIGSSVLITGREPFPGWVAVLPVGAAVLVLAGADDDAPWSFTRLSRGRVVQWVGGCSYSIYLWHWPLLIAAPWIVRRTLRWPDLLVVLAVTLVLAQLSRRFVEDPVRLGRRWRGRRAAYGFAVGGLVLLLLAVVGGTQVVQRSNTIQAGNAVSRVQRGEACFGAAAMVEAGGCTSPYARPPGLDLAFAKSDLDEATRRCQQDVAVAELTLCTFGETTAPRRTVVVVGNSHALRLVPMLEEYGRSRGWKIILAAKTDCMGLIVAPVGSEPRTSCHTWSAALLQHLTTMPKPDLVIFASHDNAAAYLAGPGATAPDLAVARQRMVEVWSRLRALGIPVAVTEDVPGMRPDAAPECIARSTAAYDPCAVPTNSVVRLNLMTEAADQHPELVDYVRLEPYFCDPAHCHALIGGVVVYTDSHHMTTTFAQTLARFVGPQLASAFGT